VTYNRLRAFSFTGQVPWRSCGAFFIQSLNPENSVVPFLGAYPLFRLQVAE